jgi:hypothetical protein
MKGGVGLVADSQIGVGLGGVGLVADISLEGFPRDGLTYRPQQSSSFLEVQLWTGELNFAERLPHLRAAGWDQRDSDPA